MKFRVLGKISAFLAFMIIGVEVWTRIQIEILIEDMRLAEVLVKGSVTAITVFFVIGISVRVRLVEMVSLLIFEKVPIVIQWVMDPPG